MGVADQDEVFDEWWRRLSAEGECDAFGGKQYERVKAEWQAESRPEDIEEFIRAAERASWAPPGGPKPGSA